LLTLREKLQGVSVSVDTCPVSEPVLLRYCGWAGPRDERLLDLEPFRVGADRAATPMASEADGFLFSQSQHRYLHSPHNPSDVRGSVRL
jgi:hypothetical protein